MPAYAVRSSDRPDTLGKWRPSCPKKWSGINSPCAPIARKPTPSKSNTTLEMDSSLIIRPPRCVVSVDGDHWTPRSGKSQPQVPFRQPRKGEGIRRRAAPFEGVPDVDGV